MPWKVEADVEEFTAAVEAFRRRVPITPELAAQVNGFSHARGFTIAGVAQLDVIQHVHGSIEEAIKKGTPFGEWKKEVEASLTAAWGKKDSPRIETIFRNATMQAYNVGRREQMLAPDVLKFRPFWMFDGIADSRQSPICKACHGVILPWDDAWWGGHTPQLHHRCRSSIRNMRRSDAERRGITAAPPPAPAQQGFGVPPTTSPPWQPNLGKYAPKLAETYRKKEEKLKGEPHQKVTPTPVLKSKAKEFNDALELRDGGAAARRLLRQAAQEAHPGALPRNQGFYSDQLVVGKGDPALTHANAYYMPDGFLDAGRVVAREDVVRRAKNAAATMAIGHRDFIKADIGNLDGLRTLLHEEMHGHSRISTRSYAGVALSLEEIGTELAARKAVQALAPKVKLWGENDRALGFGSYHDIIQLATDTVSTKTGKTQVESMDVLLEAHRKSNLTKPGQFQTPTEALDAFVAALDVTPAQRQAIKQEFELVF